MIGSPSSPKKTNGFTTMKKMTPILGLYIYRKRENKTNIPPNGKFLKLYFVILQMRNY